METGATIRVEGLVQGVGYRYFVLRRAEELGLSGHARNLPNGDVEVVAEGPRENIERLIMDLRIGPRSAIVRDLTVEWQPATRGGRGFRVF